MQNSTTMSKKTIYLIRHGQTDFNKQGIVQGSGVDSSLNDEGHAQARKFFEAYHHINFDKFMSLSYNEPIKLWHLLVKKTFPLKLYQNLMK